MKKRLKNKNCYKSLSPYAKSFQMFNDNAMLVDVAIELYIKTDVVFDLYADYKTFKHEWFCKPIQ